MYSITSIGKIPLLTHEEEASLFKKYKQENCLYSAEKLVIHNLRYVAHLAREYKYPHVDIEDLFQEGIIGLMKAVKKFNPDKEVRFITYSVFWIRNSILTYIKNNFGIVKTITTKAHSKLFFNLNKMKNTKEVLSKVDIIRIASDLNLSDNEVIDMEIRLYSSDLSTDVVIHDGEKMTLGDTLHNLHDTSYITNKIKSDEINTLNDAISKLEGRDKDIFFKRKLLEPPMILEELSIEYGISKERVRQIEERAFNKVKQFVISKQ